jgi:hypothetical protein
LNIGIRYPEIGRFCFFLICFLLVSCAHKPPPPLAERLLVRMSSIYAQKDQPLIPLEQEKDTGEPDETRKAVFK